MDDAEQTKLRRSIETYGCVELIVWNRRSGRVVSGHQRLAALREIGEEETSCVIVDLDADNEQALSLAMNKIGGQWDDEKLREALAGFSADFDATLSGFDWQEIRELLAKSIQPQEDGFDVAAALEEVAEPVTCPGDIWQLGNHLLLCGDATKAADVARLVAAGGKKSDPENSDLARAGNMGRMKKQYTHFTPQKALRHAVLACFARFAAIKPRTEKSRESLVHQEVHGSFLWWTRADSNRGPPACEAGALTS